MDGNRGLSKLQGKIACIILASGMSIRFGKIKLLYKFQGKPLLQWSIDTANDSMADYVILVVGAYAAKILGKVQTERAQVVLNKNFKEGQSSSIKCGISNLPRDCSAAILMVADQPFIKSEYLDELIRVFKKGKRTKIVALSKGKEARNPVLVRRELFPQLLELKGDAGARSIVRRSSRLQLVPVADPKAFFDVDTESDVSEFESDN